MSMQSVWLQLLTRAGGGGDGAQKADFTGAAGTLPAGWSRIWHVDGTAELGTAPNGAPALLFDLAASTRGCCQWDAATIVDPAKFTVTAVFDEYAFDGTATRHGIAFFTEGGTTDETAVFMCQNGGRTIRLGEYDASVFSDTQSPINYHNWSGEATSRWKYTLHCNGTSLYGKMEREKDGGFAHSPGWDIARPISSFLAGTESDKVGIYSFSGIDFCCESFILHDQCGHYTDDEALQETELAPVVVAGAHNPGIFVLNTNAYTVTNTVPSALPGDLLVYCCLDRASIPPSPGWTEVLAANAGTASQYTRVFTRRADGSSNDSFIRDQFVSFGDTERYIGSMVVFRSTVPGKRPVANLTNSRKQESSSAHSYSTNFQAAAVGNVSEGGAFLVADTCVYAKDGVAGDFVSEAEEARHYSPNEAENNRLHCSVIQVMPGSSRSSLGDYAAETFHNSGNNAHNSSRCCLVIDLEDTP